MAQREAPKRLRVLWLTKGLGPGGAEQLLVGHARAADHGAFDYEAAYLLPWKQHLVPQLDAVGVPSGQPGHGAPRRSPPGRVRGRAGRPADPPTRPHRGGHLRDRRRRRPALRLGPGRGPGRARGGPRAGAGGHHRLRTEKAYPDLLRAARQVLDAGLPVRFVAVGQGPLDAELDALHADLGLGEGFRFLGYREDARRVLAGFDLFTLSSRHEGLPVSLMEALALGVPVVATEVGGVPEAIRHGQEGLLVPAGRPELLAEAITTLVEDPDRRAALAQAAARRGDAFGAPHGRAPGADLPGSGRSSSYLNFIDSLVAS